MPLAPKLVIFDTVIKVLGMANENDNAAVSNITKALASLNEDLATTTFLLLAHPAKGDGSATTVRGAGELTADLDVLWSIRKRDQGRRLLKVREGPGWPHRGNPPRVRHRGPGRHGHPAGGTGLEEDDEESDGVGTVDRLIVDAIGAASSRGEKGANGPQVVDEVAEATGLAPSSVDRAVSGLRERGVIARRRGLWNVCDPPALAPR